LLEDLWPDTDPKEASGYLNDAAYRLRAVLRPTKGQESLLVSSNDYSSYSLPGQERLWIDADAALALLEQAEVSERAGGKFLPLVEEAASYFAHGTFLEDEEGLWVYGRRGTLEQARHSCILWQAKLYKQRGWFRKAELLLCSLLEEDSTDEDVLCRLMVLLHLQQRTHEALRLYKHVVTLLAQDGLKPTASTRALVERLKTDTGQPIFQIMHNTDVLPSVMGRKEDKDRNDPSYTYHRAMLRQNTESDEAVNRREATQKIAALGLAFLTAPSTLLNISALKQLPERADSLKSDSETLSFFESLTQTCWQLSGGNELALAERILWAYLPKITSLALPPSHAQQGAARIVSQSYLLAASLAGHHNDLNARQHLSEQALLFGNLAQDRNLQIAALRQLAATFDYQDRPEKVLQTYQQAVPYLSEVSPLLRSRIYAGVSGIYAQMGQKQETIRYIGLAYESFPEKPEDDPSFLFADCGYFTLTLWEGLNHFELHQLKESALRIL